MKYFVPFHSPICVVSLFIIIEFVLIGSVCRGKW
jgi:hypothetical protein